MTWDILICSVWQRTDLLTGLLGELQRQWQPGLRVLVARDNLEMSVGDKRQMLLQAAGAEYVSFIDDDDSVAPDFVERIMGALAERPDYVGFRVHCTERGEPRVHAIHSLANSGWHNTAHTLYRDISHLNPMPRTLAIQSGFEGGYGEDGRWVDGLRGLLHTEVYIDSDLYYYQHDDGNTLFQHHRNPLIAEPPRPEQFNDFVTWL